MPQLKFKKASADEVHAKRKTQTKDVAGGTAMVKGFKAPPSWNKDTRSARFIMSSESVDRYRDIVIQSGMDTAAFEKNPQGRSEEHTSELQSLMRISYAVFCLQKKK